MSSIIKQQSYGIATETQDGLVNGPSVRNLVDNGYALSYRNRVINGAMRVAQRGTSVSITDTTAGVYQFGGPDRIRCSLNAPGVITQSQSSLIFNNRPKKTVRQTISTVPTFSSGKVVRGILYTAEGNDVVDLAESGFTVSFIFNTNVTGTYSVALLDKDETDSFVASFDATANIPTKVIVSVPPGPTSVSFDAGDGRGLNLYIGYVSIDTVITSITEEWLSGPYGAVTGHTNWTTSVGNFIELTELQIEAGQIATPFEHRPYGVELSLCQRYYEETSEVSQTFTSAVIGSASNSYPSWGMPNWGFKVTKRVAPTCHVLFSISNLGFISTNPLSNVLISNTYGNVIIASDDRGCFAHFAQSDTAMPTSAYIYNLRVRAHAELL